MHHFTAQDTATVSHSLGTGSAAGAPAVLREAAALGRSRPAGTEAHRCEVTREAEARRLAAKVGGEAFLGAVREAMRWGSWEGQVFAESQWEAERDTAIARILLLLPVPRPSVMLAWEVVRERPVASTAAAHAGEVGALVKLSDGRKAWGFGIDRATAVDAAVALAHATSEPEDPADDAVLAVGTWSTESLADLPLKAMEDWNDWDWFALNAPVLQSTVPAAYAGVIEDAAGEFNECNSLDFRQRQLTIVAVDAAGVALVRDCTFYNYEDVLVGTLVVLPMEEAFTKADRYRINAQILAIENEVLSPMPGSGEEEAQQSAELARRCRIAHDRLATERERALFAGCLAARGHDLAPALDPRSP